MQMLIQKIHHNKHQNIHLPMQQKHDSRLLLPHFDWGRILSSHKRLFLCSYPHESFSNKKQKKSWSEFKTRMLKQYFFRNSIHENPPLLKENQTEYLISLTTTP